MPNLGLIEKITNLPPQRVSEVEDFVDFLTQRESAGNVNLSDLGISREEAAEQRAALSSFAEDWELPEMGVYDKL